MGTNNRTSKRPKVFSGVQDLPTGYSSDSITNGCLVLEGGAFRGIYSEGVLDALMEAGINMQTTIGVSAGAMNGMNYVAGQIGRSARFNLTYRHDDRYVGWQAYRNNKGLIGFDFAFQNDHSVIAPFDLQRFSDPRRRFIAVATNVKTGKPEYFDRDTCGNILQAVRASATMPYVSKPVLVDDYPCLDGGCSDKIPFHWALKHGFEKIVVVRTRDESFRRKLNLKRDHLMAHMFYHKHNPFMQVLAKSNARYNKLCDEMDRLKQKNRIFVIAPMKPVDVSRIEGDMEKLGALYYQGYHEAQKLIPALKAYLSA